MLCRSSLMLLLLALVLAPLAARAASVRAVGTNFYVSNSGNDDNGKNACTGTTSPCKTLGQAIDQAHTVFSTNKDNNVFNIHVASGTYSGQGNVGLTFGLGDTSAVSFNLFPMDEKNDVTIDLSADANEGKAVTTNWAMVSQAVMLTVHQFTFQGATENAIFSGSPQSTINIFDSIFWKNSLGTDTAANLANPLLILSLGNVVLEGCNIQNNQNLVGTAGLIGAAMNSLNITDCIFAKNELSPLNGGVVTLFSGTVSLTDVTTDISGTYFVEMNGQTTASSYGTNTGLSVAMSGSAHWIDYSETALILGSSVINDEASFTAGAQGATIDALIWGGGSISCSSPHTPVLLGGAMAGSAQPAPVSSGYSVSNCNLTFPEKAVGTFADATSITFSQAASLTVEKGAELSFGAGAILKYCDTADCNNPMGTSQVLNNGNLALPPGSFLNRLELIMGYTDKMSSDAVLSMASVNGTQIWHPITFVAADVRLNFHSTLIVNPPTNQGSPLGSFAVLTVQSGFYINGTFKSVKGPSGYSAKQKGNTAQELFVVISKPDSLSGGAIFGIIVAVLVGLALIGALAFYGYRRYHLRPDYDPIIDNNPYDNL